MGKKGNKRKKYYLQNAKKSARMQRTLDADMRGFLITCANNKERDTVREAYNIFNTHADKLYGPEKLADGDAESDDGDDDPDTAIQREVAAIKNRSTQERRFQALDSGGKNVIFIRTTIDNPTELTDAILKDILEKREAVSLSILRLLPVVGTCKAHEENMVKTAQEVLFPFFSEIPHSYSILIKIRNNNSMNRNSILPVMGNLLKELNMQNCVDLTKPDYVISIDILRNICCISVSKDYFKFCKYNLQELTCKMNSMGDEPKKENEEEANTANHKNEANSDQEEINDDSKSDCQKPSDNEMQSQKTTSNKSESIQISSDESELIHISSGERENEGEPIQISSEERANESEPLPISLGE